MKKYALIFVSLLVIFGTIAVSAVNAASIIFRATNTSYNFTVSGLNPGSTYIFGVQDNNFTYSKGQFTAKKATQSITSKYKITPKCGKPVALLIHQKTANGYNIVGDASGVIICGTIK